MEYRSPNRRPAKKKKGRIILVAVIVVVVLAAIAAAIVLAGRLGGAGSGRTAGSDAYLAEGKAAVLRLTPPEDMAGDALRSYFTDAVAYAKAQGMNTLLFSGQEGLAVPWEDDAFPLVEDAAKAGTDPLAILCDAAKGQDIQVWVALAPYAGGGVTADMTGDAFELSRKQGDPDHFTVGDDAYEKLLEKSLSSLVGHYPVAGVVLTGLADTAGQSGFADALSGMKEAVGQRALVLDAASSGDALTPADGAALLAAGQADHILAAVDEGANVKTRFAAYGETESSVLLDETAGDASGAVLFTVGDEAAYGGALYGSYPASGQEAARIGFLQSTTADGGGELPAGFDIPATLQVNYPLDFDTIATDQETVFIMGNSDPAKPLTMDGTEVVRISDNGSFGIAVTLQPGDNSFTFAQGEDTITHTVTRPIPATGGDDGDDGGGEATVQNDDTSEAELGQAVQVKGVYTGGLTDPGDDSAINETYYGGAVVVVRDNFETWRYDTDAGRTLKTWAYQTTGGDWVLAKNTAWIDGDGKSAFTGLSAATEERGEWITFEGEGKPAAVISCKENLLSITMHDTSFTLPAGFTSTYVKSASVEQVEDGVRLDLEVEGLWGYQIDYTEGTRLFLKSPPTLSDDAAAPLTGVRVLLDPGHGDQDIGAPGIMGGAQTPNEKDVNLAQAQAIAYRLRQLGAEVTLLREGDTFTTTQERLAAEIEAKPDFFLSVHHNSANLNSDLSEVMGLQAFYHIPKGYTAPLSATYAQNLMDGISSATGRRPRDVAYGYFNVTRTPVCPSVLFEYGYMVNPADFADVTSAEGLYAAACGTAEGIYNTVAGLSMTNAPQPDGGSSSQSGGESDTP